VKLMSQQLTYAKAIHEAQRVAMEMDPNVICYGLGVPDPKGVFGTTEGLQEAFGEDRVFDIPTAENGMLGIGIGAAITGLRPVMVSQRLDFFLLAMDQLVNNAAKWHYTFGGQASVPLTIRLILGRGWGQGPTHSQSLQAWFAHVPGLKVVIPTTPSDAKGLLLTAIFDDNPVVFLEHRWLYNAEGEVAEGDYRVPLGKAALVREGTDVSLVATSYMTVEAMKAAELLSEKGIKCDVVNLRTISPLDWATVFASVRKTGRLIALDTGWSTGSVSSEIIARVSANLWQDLKAAPQRIALPDFPTPTSFSLTKRFYPGAEDVVRMATGMLEKNSSPEALSVLRTGYHDVPGAWFKGPF